MHKSTLQGFSLSFFTLFIVFSFLSFINRPRQEILSNAKKSTSEQAISRFNGLASILPTIEKARYYWFREAVPSNPQRPDSPASATAKSMTAFSTAFNWCVEAESGSGNRSSEKNSQASGGQAVGGFGGSSEYMSYTVSGVPSAGSYTLHLWYVSAERPQFGLVVNSVLQTVSASGSGNWTGPFLEKPVTVNLQAGMNTVRIQGVGAGANFTLDRLCVDGGSCTPPSLRLNSVGCTGTRTYALNFTTQPGAVVTTNAGRVEDDQVVNIPMGTNATVTASLDGCSTQQVALSPTCGSTGSAYNYPIPITPGAWPAYNSDVLSGQPIGDVARLESSYLIVEARKRYGGAIQIIDKTTAKKLVNWTDWGRQDELSLYGGPANFSNDVGSAIGWNPLTAGDYGQNGAPVVAWGFVTGNDNKQRLYLKTHMISWPHSNAKLLEAYNERWIALTGKEVDVIARVTFSRADQTFYVAQMQEYPTFFRSGKNNTMRWYNGNAPYTNSPFTQTNNLESSTKSFEPGGYFRMTEPWIAMEQDGVNIFLNTDKFAQSSASVEKPEWSNDNSESAFQYTYCQAANTLTIDPNGTLYHHYGFYVTASAMFQEGRDWANARTRKYGEIPNFMFDVAHGRNDWYVGNGTDQREPFLTAGWNATFVPTADGGPLTARRSSLNSPVGIWKAAQCPTLYVKLKYNGQENQLRIGFRRNGQSDTPPPRTMTNKYMTWYPNGYASGAQYFTITPIKDGQYHTYVINASANAEWKDIIQSFSLSYGDGNAVIPQENWSLLYFGATNPDQ